MKPRTSDGRNRRRKKQRNRTLRVGTWNVQGISNKMHEVMTEIKKLKMDIICLTETKRKGKGSETMNDYIHFWAGVEKSQRAKAGVSILMKKTFNKLVKDVKFVNERCLKLTIKIYGREIIILAVYAPTDDSPITVKEDFYIIISNELDTIKDRQEIILAGDLNARVGQRTNDDVIGQHGEVTLNDSGERLINLCKHYQLKVNNTFFQHKQIHKFTWERPSLMQKSIIDYIILRQKSSCKVNDVRVKRGSTRGLDHYMVMAKVEMSFDRKPEIRNNTSISNKNRKVEEWPRYKLQLLKQESIHTLYKQRLERALTERKPIDNVEMEHEQIVNALHQAASEALGKVNEKIRKNQIWWTQEIEDLVGNKNRAYNNWLMNRVPEKYSEYKTLQRQVKSKIREEKNLSWERKCTEIDSLIGGSQSTEVWRCIKNMKTNTKVNTGGTISVEKWRTHYETLLIETRPDFNTEEDVNQEEGNLDRPIITTEEMIQAVKSMKGGRSPGPGGIPAELLKYGGGILWDRLTRLMNSCLEQNCIPSQWKISHIISIHKKGTRGDANNYRGLSINSTMSRIFGKIIKRKVENETRDKISEDQSGFTSGRSCVDNIFTLQQVTEKRIANGQETHLAFVDLQKAYDSIPRYKLWTTLHKLGVSGSLIDAIKELYKDNVAFVKVGRELSEPIHTSKGLRQGCCLSPLLFNIYLESVLAEWKRRVNGMGIPIGNNTLFTLNFADDQVLIAQDAYDLEFVLRRLNNYYSEWGLNVNIDKTEYLVVNSEAQFQILIADNINIKQVDRFKYLGAVISKDGLGTEEIRNRVEQSRRVIGCLNAVWWDKHISQKTKTHIGRTMVESVLCYGSEVWTLNADNTRRVNAVEMDYLRRSARVSRVEHVTNEEIRNRMNAHESIVERIERRGLKWFGHLMRMHEQRWPRRIFQWRPPGKRKKGRPRRSWNEGISKAMRSRDLTEEDAQDRDLWRLGTGRRLQAV